MSCFCCHRRAELSRSRAIYLWISFPEILVRRDRRVNRPSFNLVSTPEIFQHLFRRKRRVVSRETLRHRSLASQRTTRPRAKTHARVAKTRTDADGRAIRIGAREEGVRRGDRGDRARLKKGTDEIEIKDKTRARPRERPRSEGNDDGRDVFQRRRCVSHLACTPSPSLLLRVLATRVDARVRRRARARRVRTRRRNIQNLARTLGRAPQLLRPR